MGTLGGRVKLEEEGLWGVVIEVYSPTPLPVPYLLPALLM